MAVIDHLDLPTKHIYLAVGVREFHPVDDIYKEIRTLRRTNEEYRGFDMPVFASGNVPKGGGRFTPRLATFRLSWKIVPEDVSHVLYVTGEQITEEGEAGPACFDLTPLSPTSKVIIQYEPPLAEIIETGVSGLTEEESDRLMEIATVKAKTDNLPADPSGMAALATAHGSGSWEGATPLQVWGHDDRRLTSRDVESEAPGEALPSEEQIERHSQDVQALLDAIKGAGFDTTKESLIKIRQLVEQIQPGGVVFKV